LPVLLRPWHRADPGDRQAGRRRHALYPRLRTGAGLRPFAHVLLYRTLRHQPWRHLLGIDPASSLGVRLSECGFIPYCRDDGLHPDISADPDLAYNRYLRSRGWQGRNPWHWVANAARVAEADSETAWMTDQAIDFMTRHANEPFCLHLSYIKPHWPYIAPAPYHALYRDAAIPEANRSAAERQDPHPVHRAFMDHDESRAFSRDDCRNRVLPTYFGLIRQIDDHLGRLRAVADSPAPWQEAGQMA